LPMKNSCRLQRLNLSRMLRWGLKGMGIFTGSPNFPLVTNLEADELAA